MSKDKNCPKHVVESSYNEIIGKIFTSVKYVEDSKVNDQIIFENDEEAYFLTHQQDCCEGVYIEDICGNLQDLENSPIIKATCKYYSPEESEDESCTWSFFTFATIKGYVDIRFYGSSNGYYSEGAHLYTIGEDGWPESVQEKEII